MLVLSRKTNESILIGNEIKITIVRTSERGVRIGIQAPPSMRILREELNDSTVFKYSEPIARESLSDLRKSKNR